MTKRLTLRESRPPYILSIEEEDVLGQEPIILERVVISLSGRNERIPSLQVVNWRESS